MKGIPLEWSRHAREMLVERRIREEWVLRTIADPDRNEERNDGHSHYIKAITEREGSFLRVVVTRGTPPNRIVTIFFDRRFRKTQ